jgi:hypothetical protein
VGRKVTHVTRAWIKHSHARTRALKGISVRPVTCVTRKTLDIFSSTLLTIALMRCDGDSLRQLSNNSLGIHPVMSGNVRYYAQIVCDMLSNP